MAGGGGGTNNTNISVNIDQNRNATADVTADGGAALGEAINLSVHADTRKSSDQEDCLTQQEMALGFDVGQNTWGGKSR